MQLRYHCSCIFPDFHCHRPICLVLLVVSVVICRVRHVFSRIGCTVIATCISTRLLGVVQKLAVERPDHNFMLLLTHSSTRIVCALVEFSIICRCWLGSCCYNCLRDGVPRHHQLVSRPASWHRLGSDIVVHEQNGEVVIYSRCCD